MKPKKEVPKAKLFTGIIYSDKDTYKKAVKELVEKFGPIEHESQEYDFTDFTAYYEDEMGDSTKKKFLVFKKLIARDKLVDIKLWTNALENKFTKLELCSKLKKRKVNLDPGYFTMHNLVLASAKDRAHKIYLKKGIYADLTLLFNKNGCQHMPHTFQDFKTKQVQEFFYRIRNLSKKDF